MQSSKFFIVLFLLIGLKGVSQNFIADINLIANKKEVSENEFAYYKRAGNNKNIMQLKQHSFVAKINPVSNMLKAAMYLYQNVISAQLSKDCPYEITCSNFSKQAIKEFGIFKGLFLSADRITRCNRIAILDLNPNEINQANGSIKDSLSKYCVND